MVVPDQALTHRSANSCYRPFQNLPMSFDYIVLYNTVIYIRCIISRFKDVPISGTMDTPATYRQSPYDTGIWTVRQSDIADYGCFDNIQIPGIYGGNG